MCFVGANRALLPRDLTISRKSTRLRTDSLVRELKRTYKTADNTTVKVVSLSGVLGLVGKHRSKVHMIDRGSGGEMPVHWIVKARTLLAIIGRRGAYASGWQLGTVCWRSGLLDTDRDKCVL